MPSFTSDLPGAPELPNLPELPDGVPRLEDFYGRQWRTMVEFSFIPLPEILRVSGLGECSRTMVEITRDETGIVDRIPSRKRSSIVKITMIALPFVRKKLWEAYKNEDKFSLQYQVFGHQSFAVVDFGEAVDCQIIAVRYDEARRNSDDPMTLTVDVAVGEWIS